MEVPFSIPSGEIRQNLVVSLGESGLPVAELREFVHYPLSIAQDQRALLIVVRIWSMLPAASSKEFALLT